MKKKPVSLWVSLLILALTGVAWAEMVAHVNFNGSTEDATGKGHDGTPTNITFGPGKFGFAMVDDGTGYVTLAPDAGTDIQIGGHDCTIAAWINTTSTQAMTVLMKTNPANGGTHEAQDRTFGVGYTAGHVGMDNGWVGSFHGTTLVTDGAWHHVAWTQTQAAAGATATWTLYVDGGVEGTNTAMAPQADPASHRIAIAKGLSATIFPNTWVGSIDDVRIYNNALTQDEIAAVMSEGDEGSPWAARYPSPADKSIDVPRDTALSWTAGQYAASHDVYFGTSFDDVNNAGSASPNGVLAGPGRDATTFDQAGLLTFGQTYYWRIDEVNAAPDNSVHKGKTWSFTAETYGYPVKPIKATASSVMTATMGPEKTIDGSGLDASDQHGVSATQMWLSKKNTSPVWIQYEFDKAYKLYQMWVWNSNQAVESSVGFGAKDVTVETSLDGTTWTALADVPEFADATGEPNYTHNTTVDFGGVQAKYVKLTIHSNWADGTKQAGLSEVRFFYVPVKAFGPTPATGATGVAIDGTLNWRPGREAVQHQVYLGTDPTALSLVNTVTAHSLGLGSLGLQYGRTCYWKVNEVNDAATPASWEGDVWSFSTPDSFVVDDFEQYNDKCNRIFYIWEDGYGYSASSDCDVAASAGNGTGSTVGNAGAPFAERTIVHGGQQAMPMAYDNTSGKSYSEATRTFDVAQDWTRGGAKTLVLYFNGLPTNTGGPVYVKIDGSKVVYDGRADDISRRRWTQWNIDLKSTGANLQSVKKLTIGVGGGKGTLYIDDILLYRTAPAAAQPVVPSTAGLVAYFAMENNVMDSSGAGNNGTVVGSPTYSPSAAGYGTAIVLNGTDSCVDLGSKPAFDPAGSLSISVWANITTWTTDWGHVMVSKRGEDSVGWQLRRRDSSKICFTTRGVGEDDTGTRIDAPVGEWIHIAAVYDNATNTKRIYINGSEDTVVNTTAGNTIAAATHNVYIGARAVAANNAQEGFFGGMLDEVRVYTRALTAGEVRYLAGDR